LSEFPIGIHGAFHVLWLVAVAVPLAAKASELARRPSPDVVLSIVILTGIWALVAGSAWGLRVMALTGSGSWGERTRRRLSGRQKHGR
jgi:hypothetical protein